MLRFKSATTVTLALAMLSITAYAAPPLPPTDGDDHLVDDNVGHTIAGWSGDDKIEANGGNDTVYGDYQDGNGFGHDIIFGGLGDDGLHGGPGNDTIRGDAGLDYLWGDAGKDTLDGGDDNDKLWGGEDNDKLLGGPGDDGLQGEDGADTLSGGPNNDILLGEDDNDILNGDAGYDTLVGGPGHDTLNGGPDADELVADFEFSGPVDQIDGGAGVDLFNVTAAYQLKSLTITPTGVSGVGPAGAVPPQRAIGTEAVKLTLDSGPSPNFATSATRVTLRGGSYADRVTSGIGDDVLAGGGGGDTLIAGLGWDTVNGGAGADILGKSINKAGSKISEVIGGTETDVLRIDGSKATGKVVIRVNVGAGFTGTIGGKPVIHVKEVERFGLVGGPLADDLRDGPGAARGLFRGFGYIGIVGGPGADFLTGGGGTDWFFYNSSSHSGATVAKADAILDFRADDQIAFSGIGLVEHQSFRFRWSEPDLRTTDGPEGTIVGDEERASYNSRLDRDGNGAADFMIVVKNFTAFKPANFTYVGAF